ncbi:hypothetical protein TNCV_2774011 [Trichonephila clavipes]|nr:hypothetical protein TNCV_2774011 [Trichonephila clavipes]
MLDVTEYPECTRSTCSLNQWVRSLVGLFTSAGTGEYFLPFSSLAEIVEVEIEVCRHLSSLRGSFTELKSHCHLYGAQAPTSQAYSPLARRHAMSLSGVLALDYVRQVALATNNNNNSTFTRISKSS